MSRERSQRPFRSVVGKAIPEVILEEILECDPVQTAIGAPALGMANAPRYVEHTLVPFFHACGVLAQGSSSDIPHGMPLDDPSRLWTTPQTLDTANAKAHRSCMSKPRSAQRAPTYTFPATTPLRDTLLTINLALTTDIRCRRRQHLRLSSTHS